VGDNEAAIKFVLYEGRISSEYNVRLSNDDQKFAPRLVSLRIVISKSDCSDDVPNSYIILSLPFYAKEGFHAFCLKETCCLRVVMSYEFIVFSYSMQACGDSCWFKMNHVPFSWFKFTPSNRTYCQQKTRFKALQCLRNLSWGHLLLNRHTWEFTLSCLWRNCTVAV
jgi:hypothetical protein